jgi:hypothetical protein
MKFVRTASRVSLFPPSAVRGRRRLTPGNPTKFIARENPTVYARHFAEVGRDAASDARPGDAPPGQQRLQGLARSAPEGGDGPGGDTRQPRGLKRESRRGKWRGGH